MQYEDIQTFSDDPVKEEFDKLITSQTPIKTVMPIEAVIAEGVDTRLETKIYDMEVMVTSPTSIDSTSENIEVSAPLLQDQQNATKSVSLTLSTSSKVPLRLVSDDFWVPYKEEISIEYSEQENTDSLHGQNN